MPANVKNIDGILSTVAEIKKIAINAVSAAGDAQNKAQQINSEAEKEERTSKEKLEQAKKTEQTAQKVHKIAKQAVTAAQLAVATAGAAIPFSAPALAAAQQALSVAKASEKTTYIAYQAAQAHRKLMEMRYRMAQACRMRAAAMLGKLTSACAGHVPKVENLTNTTVSRLKLAKTDLDDFHSRTADYVHIPVPQGMRCSSDNPTVADERTRRRDSAASDETRCVDCQKQTEAYRRWRDYQETSDIVRPDKIRDRLNPPDDVRMGILCNRYESDPRFRQRVDDFRQRLASGDPQQIEYVKVQSKKNMAGQLSEDIIKDALAPFAGKIQTQVQQVLGDGGYTKIDLVLEDMKQPVVFGKGQGMLAPKGGSVAIEVKAGQDEYLRAQKSHLDRQVQGHQSYDVSLILCTRDIKDLSSEQEYRGDIKESGSHIIGMLPRKSEINDTVWLFLNEGFKEK